MFDIFKNFMTWKYMATPTLYILMTCIVGFFTFLFILRQIYLIILEDDDFFNERGFKIFASIWVTAFLPFALLLGAPLLIWLIPIYVPVLAVIISARKKQKIVYDTDDLDLQEDIRRLEIELGIIPDPSDSLEKHRTWKELPSIPVKRGGQHMAAKRVEPPTTMIVPEPKFDYIERKPPEPLAQPETIRK